MAFARAIVATLIFFGLPVAQARSETPNTEKPMVNHMEDAVTQPAKDVNLKKVKIPAQLLAVQKDPYDLTGLDACVAINAEIDNLYPLLGPDVDDIAEFSKAEKRERGVSRIAGGILGSLIPFRGVVREITGANKSERLYLRALSAGNARRSFLKGYGLSRGCTPVPLKSS
ncbi:hypothetical protein [Parasphingorhabdus sp.]|uniref:hypothetical protein n=1 Tax=Parasphingorhabdus sp. TaxID=2709688 RepID=UPI0032665D70